MGNDLIVPDKNSEVSGLVQPCNDILPPLKEGCIINGVVDSTKTLVTCVINANLQNQYAAYCHACDSTNGCLLAHYSTNKLDAVIRGQSHDNSETPTPSSICSSRLGNNEEGCVVDQSLSLSRTKQQCKVDDVVTAILDSSGMSKEYTYCESCTLTEDGEEATTNCGAATYYRYENLGLVIPSLKHLFYTYNTNNIAAGCLKHNAGGFSVSQISEDECVPNWTDSGPDANILLYCDNCNSEAGCDIVKYWSIVDGSLQVVVAPDCGAFPANANDQRTHYCITSNPNLTPFVAPGISSDMQTTNYFATLAAGSLLPEDFNGEYGAAEFIGALTQMCSLAGPSTLCDGSPESVQASSPAVQTLIADASCDNLQTAFTEKMKNGECQCE